MSPAIYQQVLTGASAVVAAVMAVTRIYSPDNRIQERGSSPWVPLAICLLLILWIGLRPVSGAFGDTVNYALEYVNMDSHSVSMDWSEEWVWQFFMNGCKTAGLSLSVFFLIIAAIYIFSAFWAVRILLPDDTMLGIIFVISSLMFFPFAVNGLRNGLACHLVLLGAAFLLNDKWIPGSLVCLMALGIHRSVMLPIVAILFAIFVTRNVRYAIAFWVASIFISLFAGELITGFFTGLGFDERMNQYITLDEMQQFSKAGFRWDFLLYSAIPVAMGWYICIYRQVSDNWYNVLFTVYCFCNAFWIMIIRSAFSNRFAYLSWFLYPLVIAYPLANLRIREDQDQFTGWILLAYSAISVFMWFVFW